MPGSPALPLPRIRGLWSPFWSKTADSAPPLPFPSPAPFCARLSSAERPAENGRRTPADPFGAVFCYAFGMNRSGQTLIEYILAAAALLGAVAAAGYFVRTVRTQTERTGTVLGSEYP